MNKTKVTTLLLAGTFLTAAFSGHGMFQCFPEDAIFGEEAILPELRRFSTHSQPCVTGGGGFIVCNVNVRLTAPDSLFCTYQRLFLFSPESAEIGVSFSVQALPLPASLGDIVPEPDVTYPEAFLVLRGKLSYANRYSTLSYVVENVAKQGLLVTIEEDKARSAATELLLKAFSDHKHDIFRHVPESGSCVQPYIEPLTEAMVAFGRAVMDNPKPTPVYRIDLGTLCSVSGFSPRSSIDVTVDVRGRGAFRSRQELSDTTPSFLVIEAPATDDFVVFVFVRDRVKGKEVHHTELLLHESSVQELKGRGLLSVDGRPVREAVSEILQISPLWEELPLIDQYRLLSEGKITDRHFRLISQLSLNDLSIFVPENDVVLKIGGCAPERLLGLSVPLDLTSHVASTLMDIARAGVSDNPLPWDGQKVERATFSLTLVKDMHTPGVLLPPGSVVPAGQVKDMYQGLFRAHFELPFGDPPLGTPAPLSRLLGILTDVEFMVGGDKKKAKVIAEEVRKKYCAFYGAPAARIAAQTGLLNELKRVGVMKPDGTITSLSPCLQQRIFDFMQEIGSTAPLPGKLIVTPPRPDMDYVVLNVPNGDYPEYVDKTKGLPPGGRALFVAAYDSAHKAVHYAFAVVSEHPVLIGGCVQDMMLETFTLNALEPAPLPMQLMTGNLPEA
ncbi:MAG: hypothetical protein LBJ70_05275 [Holosporales bacterium]|jgi:hypothetical protein|nr:hypothetical protein [Holosporales bacterium]